ncbi:MAG TPA: hypothetical protein VF335_08030 [Chitinivibrionales bacterium]
MKISVQPDAREKQDIVINDETAKTYSLDRSAAEFWLMTAGYRAPLDPNDIANPEAPFNALTIMICAEAKARVFKRQLKSSEKGHVHIGGEVRPHTQDFIKLTSRVYAAHGFIVHLRKQLNTTPIWYSSFGIAFEEFQTGDNFTASHSQFFKGGWKPADGSGKQLIIEEEPIVREVRRIISGRETIHLSPWEQPGVILHDFDVDEAYTAYLRQVMGDDLFVHIRKAAAQGFKAIICPVGGSMKATTERLFDRLGISHGNFGIVDYIFGEENSRYHDIGQINGENYGVDPGKWQIYKNVGIHEYLLDGRADIGIIWDPDGDRIKIASKAPLSQKNELTDIGVEIDERSVGNTCVAYFTPNQLYVMIAAYKLQSLGASGQIKSFDWFIGASFPTTMALAQLAKSEGVGFIQVPVGFKNFGDLCEKIENQLGGDVTIETAIGQKVFLGKKPRAIILCEESGGATMGGFELLKSKNGKNKMLTLREKDGMQIGLAMLGLAAKLKLEESSLASFYLSLVTNKNIRWLHYVRRDATLYDERLLGAALQAAKEAGVKKRDVTVAFFKTLIQDYQSGKATLTDLSVRINRAKPAGAAAVFPKITGAGWIGDGPLFESDGVRFIMRASGTDAVLRYYLEGTDKKFLENLLALVSDLQIS